MKDSQGRTIRLGDRIAQGGEGAVFRLPDRADLVAKLYHKPPGEERVGKLRAMVATQSPDLLKLACWPVELLSEDGQVKGFLMPNAAQRKEIHKLYSPKSRAMEFRNVDWRFLIASAANVARSFGVVHKSGHVIGDVNHSSVMIAEDATVCLIDCDSFEIEADGRRFPCEVAEPLHTAPELQGTNPKSVVHTANHDNFGLAVLIFELLFMGRHPYAGAYLGSGEKGLEQKIAGYLFAYGEDAESRQMKQPPHTLALEAVSPEVATLFRRAFLAPERDNRPSATEWIAALNGLQAKLKKCEKDEAHFYFQELSACPWCAIEKAVGISLFTVAFSATAMQGTLNLALVWDSIQKVPKPKTASRPAKRSTTPPSPDPRYVAIGKRQKVCRWTAIGAFPLIIIATVIWSLSFWVFFALLLAALALDSIPKRRRDEARREVQNAIEVATLKVHKLRDTWDNKASSKPFMTALQELTEKKDELQDFGKTRDREMDRLKANMERSQLTHYLDGHPIQPGVIPGVGPGRCTTLSSYGIETAADLDRKALLGVPGFGDHLIGQLMDWRASLVQGFRFDPSKGLDPADVRKVEMDLIARRQLLERELVAGPSRLQRAARQIEAAGEALLPQMEQALQEVAQAEANLSVL